MLTDRPIIITNRRTLERGIKSMQKSREGQSVLNAATFTLRGTVRCSR